MTPGCVVPRGKSSVTAPIDHVVRLSAHALAPSRAAYVVAQWWPRWLSPPPPETMPGIEPSHPGETMQTATFDTPTERTQETVSETTMQAIVQDKYGSAEVLQLR